MMSEVHEEQQPTRGGERLDVLERRLLKAAGQAVGDFPLIEEGDRVLVALSGGKDSSTLLRILLKMQRRAPVRFELAAANVDPGYPGYAADVVRDYAQSLGVPIHLLTPPIYDLIQEKIAPGQTACPLCSRMRRGALYTLCKREGYTKLALGHHLDDAIETLLLNVLYSGSLRSMPLLLERSEPPAVIRPLSYALERDIAGYARAVAIPIVHCASSTCGCDDQRRQVIKRLLAGLEAEHPGLKHQARRALANVDPSFLWDRELLAAVRTDGA